MVDLMHGGDIYSAAVKAGVDPAGILDFSANINPLGLPEGVRKAIIQAVDQAVHYPDPLCRDLVGHIARYEGVDPGAVVCGNGAADLIFRLAEGLRPKRALLPVPTFLEYEQALKGVGCEIIPYPLDVERGFELDEGILDWIGPEIDLLVLCSPNNPTGLPVDKDLLRAIAARCSQWEVRFLLDECFNDFLDEGKAYSMVEESGSNPLLFILKAFTKLYAMPGIRLGYGLCSDREWIRAISAQGQPWSVSSLAQAGGIAALAEEEYRIQTKALIRRERDYLKGALKDLGLQVFDSQANFVFFRAEHRPDLHESLLSKGILIRHCGNYPGLTGEYYRVAVKNHDQNERLIAGLEEVMVP